MPNLLYGKEGRLHGHFVYALQCSDTDRFIIKIGISRDPLKRMDSIRTGCPYVPQLLATMHFVDSRDALAAEGMFHTALAKYRMHGEWFAIPKTDKTSFNQATALVRSQLARPSWPLRWVKINAAEVILQKSRTKMYMAKLFKRRGLAYRDAVKSGMKPLR